MKIPRDVDADDLVKALRMLGYRVDRQEGSHIRISTELNGEHHVTIPGTGRLRLARSSKVCSSR